MTQWHPGDELPSPPQKTTVETLREQRDMARKVAKSRHVQLKRARDRIAALLNQNHRQADTLRRLKARVRALLTEAK